MAFLSLNPSGFNTGSGFNNASQFPGTGGFGSQNNSLGFSPSPQMNEVFLGQILSQIVVRAILSFDDPKTTQSGVSNNPPQLGGSVSNSPPQLGGGVSNNPPQARPPANQIGGSANLTQEGGLSFGGGVRVAGGGTPFGFSAVGQTTINGREGYQTSGGISALGLSANAGVRLNSGGLQFSGGITRAQVGQGIVGSKVGSALVGPGIVGPRIVGP